ncbi:MAG: MBOAT family protein [Roseivirga sp.]|nr:MBOAT family protein [Roseivirga sp.]
MTFISFEFLLFITGCLVIYFAISSRWKWLWLLVCSYFFYGYHNLIYVPLLMFSTVVDYWIGLKIGSTEKPILRKRWLYLSIFVNLSLLAFFKYFNFFNGEFQGLAGYLGMRVSSFQHNYLLPLGISFYTFQTLGYSIDVYRKYIKPEKHIGKYALYVSFFPQLIAGPIERGRKLLPQLSLQVSFDYQRTVEGLQLILWGLFKKMVIADRLGLYVNQIFDISNNHQGPAVIFGAFLFGLQILFDFAAYSEIAIGLARILGVKLSRNFGNVSFFTSPVHMWNNWHITLTSWFRDYVYFPLTRSNKNKWASHSALIITFLITGLWHGASWGFIIWGGLHGIYLAFDHITAQSRNQLYTSIGLEKNSRVRRLIGILVFLPFNILTGFFFRASSTSNAFTLIERSLDWSSVYLYIRTVGAAELLLIISLLIGVEFVNNKLGKRQIHHFLVEKPTHVRWLFYFVLTEAILLLRLSEVEKSPFIYFDF